MCIILFPSPPNFSLNNISKNTGVYIYYIYPFKMRFKPFMSRFSPYSLNFNFFSPHPQFSFFPPAAFPPSPHHHRIFQNIYPCKNKKIEKILTSHPFSNSSCLKTFIPETKKIIKIKNIKL